MKEKLAKAFSNFHCLTLHIVGESISDYCFVVLMHNVVLNGVFFLFIQYSYSTYLDHDEGHPVHIYSLFPHCSPHVAARCKLPLPSALVYPAKMYQNTKGITPEKNIRNHQRKGTHCTRPLLLLCRCHKGRGGE